MKSILYRAFCFTLVLLPFGQARSQSESPFTITISQVQPSLRLGNPILIHIVLKSTERGVLTLPEERHDGTRGEMNYLTYVTDARGDPVQDSRLGQKLKTGQAAGQRSVMIRHLNPGAEIAEDLDLNSVVKITFPGTYVVQVERADRLYGPLHIKSNKLTIHIDEP